MYYNGLLINENEIDKRLFDTLLEAFGLGAVDSGVNRKQLWYDDEFYRYGLYITPAKLSMTLVDGNSTYSDFCFT